MKNRKSKLAALALIPALSAIAYVGSAFAADTTVTSPASSTTMQKWMGHHRGMHDDTQFAADLASVLGLNASDVKAKLDAGTKPADIITSTGKTEADVQAQLKTLRETELKAKLAASVAAGTITQAQADQMITRMANKKFNHAGGPGMHMMGHHGRGFNKGNVTPTPSTISTQ